MSTQSRRERRWLIQQLKPFGEWQLASFALIAVGSVTALLSPLIMKWLIDGILPHKKWQLLPVAAIGFLLTYLLQIGSYWAATLATFRSVQRMMFDIRIKLLEHLQRLSADYHERTSPGDVVFRLEQDVEQVGELCAEIIPTSARTLLTVLLSFGTMLALNAKLACLVLPLIPVFIAVHRHYQNAMQRHSEAVQEISGKRSALLHELLPAIVQVQFLCRERTQTRKFARVAATASRAAVQRETTAMWFSIASVTVVISGMVLILGYGGYQVMAGALTVGGLVAFYTYLGAMFSPLSGAVQTYSRFQRVIASIRRIQELEDSVPSVQTMPGSVSLAGKPSLAISFRDVSFSYVLGAWALKDVNLEVAPGEQIAVVGATGSGKSSIAKLLARMYDAQGGIVSIDGCSVRQADLTSLRSVVAFVPQAPVLFRGSVMENLLLGNPYATTSQLHSVLHIAQLSPPGDEADRVLQCSCEQLSGGERQRVCLARALLQDRPILVLDEATSALDPFTEELFLRALKKHFASTTVIAITHRENTARWADRVIFVAGGRIVGGGTHHQLMDVSQPYRRLWRNERNPYQPGTEALFTHGSLEKTYAENS